MKFEQKLDYKIWSSKLSKLIVYYSVGFMSQQAPNWTKCFLLGHC